MNEWVNSAVAQSVADANVNTELAPDANMGGGHLVDMNGDCDDAD